MNYNALDFIACPVDKHFPLKLHVTDVRETGIPNNGYWCQQYCGYLGESITDIGTPSRSCEECRSKSIEQGVLFCEACGSLYQIRNGILKLIPDNLKEQEEIQFLEQRRSYFTEQSTQTQKRYNDDFVLKIKKAEMRSRAEIDQKGIIASLTSKRHQFLKKAEFEAVSRRLEVKENDIILDAGAGYGVFSIPLSKKCSYIVATDITFEVLQAFREFCFRLSTSYFTGYDEFPEGKICLIQADICRMPFRKGFQFDKMLSTQVLSYIAGSVEKATAIKEAVNLLKKNGLFVLTVANRRLLRQIKKLVRHHKEEESLKDNRGVYYYEFNKGELRNLLEPFFTVEEILGLQNFPSVIHINKGLAMLFEKIIQLTPSSLLFGKILLAKCRKVV